MNFAQPARRHRGHPFGPEILVYRIAGKMFALVDWQAEPLSINLKCEPELALLLREIHPEVKPGWHMNKQHWNTVTLSEGLSDDLWQGLDSPHSYERVVAGLPRAKRPQAPARPSGRVDPCRLLSSPRIVPSRRRTYQGCWICSSSRYAAWGLHTTARSRWSSGPGRHHPGLASQLREHHGWVIEQDDVPLGFATLSDDGHLSLLYVSADHPRQGLGTLLLERVLAAASQMGLGSLTTEASAFSLALFLRHGFLLTGLETVERGGVNLSAIGSTAACHDGFSH